MSLCLCLSVSRCVLFVSECSRCVLFVSECLTSQDVFVFVWVFQMCFMWALTVTRRLWVDFAGKSIISQRLPLPASMTMVTIMKIIISGWLRLVIYEHQDDRDTSFISLTMMMKWWMVILHILDSTLPPPTCAPNQHLLVVTNHLGKLSFDLKGRHPRKRGCFFLGRGPKDQASFRHE